MAARAQVSRSSTGVERIASTANATSWRDSVRGVRLRQVASLDLRGPLEDGRHEGLVRLSWGEAPHRCEVVRGAQRGGADHLVERRPDLLPQQRVWQVRQTLEREGERLRVQSHQRVVVVAQVRVDEERRGTPDGLRDGQLARR